MGSVIRVWKTMPIPAGAAVGRNGAVTRLVKRTKKIGKLSGTNRVSLQADTWTAQFVDEIGKVRRVSAPTTVRSVAEKMLAQYEKKLSASKPVSSPMKNWKGYKSSIHWRWSDQYDAGIGTVAGILSSLAAVPEGVPQWQCLRIPATWLLSLKKH